MEQSFESTGSAQKVGDSKRTVDFDKLGERRIIMASNETWLVWQEVFRKHEASELIDVDTLRSFKDIAGKGKENKASVVTALNQNQLRNLHGLDDAAVAELGMKILEKNPKAFVKRPTSWSHSLPIHQWCTNKKQKVVVAKLIADMAMELQVEGADKVFVGKDLNPRAWSDLKAQLCINGFHMWIAVNSNKKWINLKCGSGKKVPEPSKQVIVVITRIMENNSHFNVCRRCSRGSVCKWMRVEMKFNPTLYIKRVAQGWRPYECGPATIEFCEVGIMDLRMFPKTGNFEIACGYKKVLQELRVVSKNSMSTTVHTWMIIFSSNRAATVDELVKEFFLEHKLRREAQYVYCKGEPMYTPKSRVKVVYLQRLKKTSMNSKLVNTACRVQKLLEREDEILSTDAEMYKSREACRHDRTHLTDFGELRYEVYLRIIDRFCRDQWTMMLLFAGAKAVSACSVSLSSWFVHM